MLHPSAMKLLVFAHTPPPHHGQSYMVQLMLEGFGGDRRKATTSVRQGQGPDTIECYHVNARLSQNLEDIGDLRIGKFILLLGYILQAIWCRFRWVGICRENAGDFPLPRTSWASASLRHQSRGHQRNL